MTDYGLTSVRTYLTLVEVVRFNVSLGDGLNVSRLWSRVTQNDAIMDVREISRRTFASLEDVYSFIFWDDTRVEYSDRYDSTVSNSFISVSSESASGFLSDQSRRTLPEYSQESWISLNLFLYVIDDDRIPRLCFISSVSYSFDFFFSPTSSHLASMISLSSSLLDPLRRSMFYLWAFPIPCLVSRLCHSLYRIFSKFCVSSFEDQLSRPCLHKWRSYESWSISSNFLDVLYVQDLCLICFRIAVHICERFDEEQNVFRWDVDPLSCDSNHVLQLDKNRLIRSACLWTSVMSFDNW